MLDRARPPLWPSMRAIWVMLALALALAIGSVLTALVWFVALATAAFAAMLLVDGLVGPSPATLRVTRRETGFVAVGRPGVIAYDVENRAHVPICLGIVETPAATIQFGDPIEGVRIAARAAAVVERTFVATERGPAELGPFYLWVENRLGLLRRRYVVDAREAVRVFPDLSAVEQYGYLARRTTLLDAGLRKLRMRGAGTEFESLREYVAGDPFKRIDWKATARRGRPMVAQFEVERSQQVVVALDCGRLMLPRIGARRKFDYALTGALSIARAAAAAGDNVAMEAFAAAPVLAFAPRRGRAHASALERAAYGLQPRMEEPDYETAFGGLQRRYPKRSLIVAFTDMFDPVASAAVLAGLKALARKHLVMCVLMNDAALGAALAAVPTSPRAAYRVSVAMRLADERRLAVANLRSSGAIVVDVPAARLTLALLDAYLDVKGRGLL